MCQHRTPTLPLVLQRAPSYAAADRRSPNVALGPLRDSLVRHSCGAATQEPTLQRTHQWPFVAVCTAHASNIPAYGDPTPLKECLDGFFPIGAGTGNAVLGGRGDHYETPSLEDMAEAIKHFPRYELWSAEEAHPSTRPRMISVARQPWGWQTGPFLRVWGQS